jgi:ABC-type antimicrobial peptide transport system permease subunit
MGASLPGIYLAPQAMLLAVGIMIGAGILAGLFPALKAMRLTIVDALARG